MSRPLRSIPTGAGNVPSGADPIAAVALAVATGQLSEAQLAALRVLLDVQSPDTAAPPQLVGLSSAPHAAAEDSPFGQPSAPQPTRDVVLEPSQAEPVASGDITDGDRQLIRLHLDWARRTGATAETLRARRQTITALARRIPVPLEDATPAILDTWQASLRVSLASVRTYTANVRTFYRWMLDAGHLDVDPATRLPLPKLPDRAPRPIPADDLRVAVECAPEPIRTFLVLAAFMGLRAMEVAGLLRENITETDSRLILSGIGKGQKRFALPVPVDVEPYLRPHRRGGQRGPLFRMPSGRQYTPRDVSLQTSLFFQAIGMPYTLHWCRHFFGTSFYGATKDILLTQDVMRHSNPSTTRIYVETTSAEATAALDRLAKALAPRDAARRRPRGRR